MNPPHLPYPRLCSIAFSSIAGAALIVACAAETPATEPTVKAASQSNTPTTATGQEQRPRVVTGTISGTVTDSAKGRSVIQAKISVQETKLSATTGENGQFTLANVPSGAHVVTVKAFGYKPVTQSVTVPDTGRVALKFVLTSVPTLLSGVVTTATGQEQRLRGVGSGVHSTLTDLSETRVPGQEQRLRGVGSGVHSTLTDLSETRVPGQ